MTLPRVLPPEIATVGEQVRGIMIPGWMKDELEELYSAFRVVDDKWCSRYKRLETEFADVLVQSGRLRSLTLEERRNLLEESPISVQRCGGGNSQQLRELAQQWTMVLFHSGRKDIRWLDECSLALRMAGEICQSASGEEAFAWNLELSKMLMIWQQGLPYVVDPHGGEADLSGFSSGWSHGLDTHPSLRFLAHCPQIVRSIDSFFCSAEEGELWQETSDFLLGRFLFNYGLSVGLRDLNDFDSSPRYLPLMNGAIVCWPASFARGRKVTDTLNEKWGVTTESTICRPGYFASEAWRQKLLAAAQVYLDSYATLFAIEEVSSSDRASAWKNFGESLEVFRQPLAAYELDLW